MNKLVCLLLLIFLVSCVSRQSAVTSANSQLVQPLAEQPAINPYQVSVVNELYDGQTLFINLEITDLSDSAVRPAYLRLQTTNQGIAKAEKFYSFGQLKLDQSKQTVVSIEAGPDDDYQVSMLWGASARQQFKEQFLRIRDLIKLSPVDVKKVKSCLAAVCTLQYRLSFALTNLSEILLPELALRVSLFSDAEFNPEDDLAVYEQLIALEGIDLRTGETCNFNYTIIEPAELAELSLRVAVATEPLLE